MKESKDNKLVLARFLAVTKSLTKSTKKEELFVQRLKSTGGGSIDCGSIMR